MKLRQEVLTQWPTGKGVDLEEAFAFHKSLPQEKIFSQKLIDAKEQHKTLVQPRAGVPVVEEHIKLLQFLQDEGEADLLPTTIDSYTRQNRYEEAENGIRESMRLGRAMLNGFPAVNHGVSGCRHVVNSVQVPLQVRHGTPDARLLTEITYAGGFTSYEGGGISYNLPYCKSVPLERTILDWQYVDRLTGLYEENGVSINREPYGPLTGTLVPPCMSHAVAIIEALLAAEQGVKNITVGYGQCGNLVQDVAAIQTLQELTEEYLKKYGYGDVTVTTVLHQWMGGFPADEAKAFGVIAWGAACATLAKATKVIVKTPHEAAGVPTKEANAAGLRCTKQLTNMLLDQVTVGFPYGRTRRKSSRRRPAASWIKLSRWDMATSSWAPSQPSTRASSISRSALQNATPASCCQPATTAALSVFWKSATCRSPMTSRSSTAKTGRACQGGKPRGILPDGY